MQKSARILAVVFAVCLVAALAFVVGRRGGPESGLQLSAPGGNRGVIDYRETPTPGEGVLVPVSPCRVLDTRGHGALTSGVARQVRVTGGIVGGCLIPRATIAVAVSITVLDPSAAGYLAVYPTGTDRPYARQGTFSKSQSSTFSTTAMVGTNGDIAVYLGGASAEVLVDVTGYYNSQLHVNVQANGDIEWGTDRILGVNHDQTGHYYISLLRTDLGCNVFANSFTANTSAIANPTNVDGDVEVHTYVDNGADLEPADESFGLVVVC